MHLSCIWYFLRNSSLVFFKNCAALYSKIAFLVVLDRFEKNVHTPGCVSKNRTQTQPPLAFALSIAFTFSQFCKEGTTWIFELIQKYENFYPRTMWSTLWFKITVPNLYPDCDCKNRTQTHPVVWECFTYNQQLFEETWAPIQNVHHLYKSRCDYFIWK